MTGSRSVRRSLILLAGLLLLAILLLAACSSGTTTTAVSGSTTESTASTGSTEPAGGSGAKYGGTLRIAWIPPGPNIGWPVTQTNAAPILQYFYETLLRSDEKGNLYPWLAESYEVAEDRLAITFHLRQGVKFTDGSDMTAEVVMWNLEQWLPMQPSWASVEAVDASTVRVNLKMWDNTVPVSFSDATPSIQIVSKAAFDQLGEEGIAQHPVGTGPFIVDSFTPEVSLKLVKNPDYWGTDKDGNKLPYLDAVEFTFVGDLQVQFNMATAGETDVVHVNPGKQAKEYTDLGWDVVAVYDSNEIWVPDSAHPDSPWSKKEVREAAEYAVDRAQIADWFGFGYYQPPYRILPRGATAFDPAATAARPYDPEKAKDLLAHAGYPDGFDTQLILWVGGSKDIAIAEQEYLAAVGIRAEIVETDFAKLSQYMGPTGSWNNALLEMVAPAQGATGIGCLLFGSFMFGSNWALPPEYGQALGAAISSPEADANLIRAASDILTDGALIIPLYETGNGMGWQPKVEVDFGHRGQAVYYDVESIWLDK